MDDPYTKLIDEHWNEIVMMYDAFRKNQPIIEFDVACAKLYSYSAEDYISSLSSRTKSQTKRQYDEACKKNQFMLFIRDEKKQILRSYIYKIAKKIND